MDFAICEHPYVRSCHVKQNLINGLHVPHTIFRIVGYLFHSRSKVQHCASLFLVSLALSSLIVAMLMTISA